MLSIIIPTLNAGESLKNLIAQIDQCGAEIILSDGGSGDQSLRHAIKSKARIAMGDKGRGQQLARGCRWAKGDWFLILHADTVLDKNWQDAVNAHIKNNSEKAGYFKFSVYGNGLKNRWLTFWTRIRCVCFRLPYGDQGLLISRALYTDIGGYQKIPLFEDVDIIRKLSARRALVSIPVPIFTNPARYQSGGYIRRPIQNLTLLFRYLFGADPSQLAKRYK